MGLRVGLAASFHALHNCLVILPLLLLLRQERYEPGILPQVIEVPVCLEQRKTRKAIIGGRLQPLDCLLRFIHQRVGARNVIGRVVKVTEPFSFLDRQFDLVFRHALLPC